MLLGTNRKFTAATSGGPHVIPLAPEGVCQHARAAAKGSLWLQRQAALGHAQSAAELWHSHLSAALLGTLSAELPALVVAVGIAPFQIAHVLSAHMLQSHVAIPGEYSITNSTINACHTETAH